MEFTCLKSQLSAAIGSVSRAVSMKTNVPALEGVCISLGDRRAVLYCTDNEIAIEYTISADVRSPGSAIVNAKLFGDIVRSLPSEDVHVRSSGDGGRITLSSGQSVFDVLAIQEGAFPAFPEVSSGAPYRIDQHVLRKMMSQTSFAISTDESRKTLTGLFLESGDGEIRACAVDGFRIALRRQAVLPPGGGSGESGESGGGRIDGEAGAGGAGDAGGAGGAGDAGGYGEAAAGGIGGYVADGAGGYGASGAAGIGGEGAGEGAAGAYGAAGAGGPAAVVDVPVGEPIGEQIGEPADGRREDAPGGWQDNAPGSGRDGAAPAGAPYGAESLSLIVPARTVSELIKIIPAESGELELYGDRNQAVAVFGRCRVFTRIIDGEFFNYKYIIPSEYVTQMIVSRDDLLGALERATVIIAHEQIKRRPVIFSIAGNSVRVRALGDAGAADVSVSADIQGEDIEVGFNPHFFMDALKAIEDGEIAIRFTTKVGQCVIRPINNDSYTYLILPVKVADI